MKRIALALALLIAGLSPGIATPRPVHLHCTLDGQPFADLRDTDGHYRLRIAGERKWSRLHDNAVGMGLVMLWAGGVKCMRR